MKVKNLFAMALAGMTFVACNNNDDVPAIDNGPAAGKAYAAVSVSIKGTGTRANGDPNAFAAENNISNIWLYVENERIAIDKANFNWVDGVGTATVAYEVPGVAEDTKKAFVVVNKVEPTGMALNASYFGASPANIYKNLVGALTVADNYTMFSKAEATVTLKATKGEAITAAPTVTVQRAAAKVLVKDSDKDYAGSNVDVTNGQGTISAGSLKWYIGNSNRSLYCTPQTGNKDPNYTWVSQAWDAYNNDYEQLSDAVGGWRTLDGTPAGTALNRLINIAEANTTFASATIDNVLYCNENTNDDYKVSNTTYVLLQAEFIPKQLINSNVSGTELLPTVPAASDLIPGTAGTTFYLHKESGVYFTAAGVTSYNAKFGKTGFDDFFIYEDSKCYYRINLKDAPAAGGNLGVLRNHYYSMAIGEIKGLGSWTDPTNPVNPNIPGVDEPAEPKTALVAVNIEVEKWNTEDMGIVKPL